MCPCSQALGDPMCPQALAAPRHLPGRQEDGVLPAPRCSLEAGDDTKSQLTHFSCLINNFMLGNCHWPRCSELNFRRGRAHMDPAQGQRVQQSMLCRVWLLPI